ncbi:unnamed protein product, partial [Rotaria sp. Silwood1]
MEQEILKHLPRNWNVFVINGNERPVSTTIRRHLKKLHPRISRLRQLRNPKPMMVLFYFMNGCITVPKRCAKKKNKSNHVVESMQQAPSESDFAPTQQPPIEPDLTPVVSPIQQVPIEQDAVLDISPIEQLVEQKRESVEVSPQYDPPTTNLVPDSIIRHFENLNVQPSSVFIDFSPPPPITTTTSINSQNLFNQNENEDENNDEEEPISILETRQKNKEILDEWNEKIEKIREQIRTAKEETQKQIRKLNEETQKQIRKLNEKTQNEINDWNEKINVVIQQRDEIKQDLEKILNEKILEWKGKKSSRQSKKSIKRS